MSNQAVAVKKQRAALDNLLKQLKSQVELALPGHMNADRMCRLALTAFSSTPALQNCSMESIAACVMISSQLGLEIGVNGQAYMIPYGKTATFVPGWKGLIDLVNRAGRASVWTGAVFEGDFFEWELGATPRLVHRPMGENDPDKLLFAYAIGRVKDAEYPVIECWPNARVTKHFHKYNKVGAKHYAHDNWEMYARKIVLLQVLKYLPQSVELSTAVEQVHKAESIVLEGTSSPVIDSLGKLTEQLEGSDKPADEPTEEPSEDVKPDGEPVKSALEDLADELKSAEDSPAVEYVRAQYIEAAASDEDKKVIRELCAVRLKELKAK